MKPKFGCECKDCDPISECAHSCAPIAFSVERNGKTIKVCTRCDLSTDKNKKLLVTMKMEMSWFFDYDALGAFCLVNAFAKERSTKEVKHDDI